jgi:hypothetical protein
VKAWPPGPGKFSVHGRAVFQERRFSVSI